MTYTDDEILDLMDVLDTVGQSETPNDELKRLLREWEQGSPVYQMGGKTPAEIQQIQRELLGVVPDGFVGVTTKEAVYKWSTAAFYLWLKSRTKEVYVLEVGGTSSYSAKYMVLYKEYAACFRRREVLPTTEEKVIEAGYSYYKLWDEIPSELNFPGTSH
jgi:hypothetical protein